MKKVIIFQTKSAEFNYKFQIQSNLVNSNI